MTKLTDIQATLLSKAAQRDSGHLLPLPEVLAGKDEPARRAIQQLIKRGFAAKAPTNIAAQQTHEDGGQRFGAIITEAGQQVIGAVELTDGAAAPGAANIVAPPPRPETKQAKILELLRREQGASVEDLMQATGWRTSCRCSP